MPRFVPALLLLGFFFVVPLVIIVLYSFWEVVDYNVVHHWTTGNYTYFFSVSTYVDDDVGHPLGRDWSRPRS